MAAQRPNAARAERVLDAVLTRLDQAPGFQRFLAAQGEQGELDLLIELQSSVERVLDGG